MISWRAPVLVVLALPLLAAAAGAGQTATATRAAAYRAPRAPDGHPDLQGIWQAVNAAAWDIEDHAARLGVPAGYGVVEGGELPYQPSALAQRKKNFDARLTADTAAKCYLPGVPRITYMPFPFQIFQAYPTRRGDGEYGLDRDLGVAINYEYLEAIRYIHTDGSPHLDNGPQWMGDSRGRWEGDTLVVDVTNFNDETWFDASGNFHSDALHVVERYTRTGPDTLWYEATIDDPKVFTRPWKMRMPLYRRQEPGLRLLEYYCHGYAEEERHRKGQ